MKRNNSVVSMRKPHATSLARASVLTESFFKKYSEIVEKHKLGTELICVDECWLFTVHSPPKTAAKGSKEVGSVTSGEGGVTVNITGCINALGNSFP
jgi:hypothetical protein